MTAPHEAEIATQSSGKRSRAVGADARWDVPTLYSFTGGKDGGAPRTTLATDGLGFLYGVASEGGSHKRADCVTYGCGTVFRVPE